VAVLPPAERRIGLATAFTVSGNHAMPYVDGLDVDVSVARRDAHRALAKKAAAGLRRALRVVDCWGDDVPEG
jgi:hypothetical protein